MLKEALQWIKDQVIEQQMMYEVDGITYSRSPIYKVEEPIPDTPETTDPLETSSLSSVVEYIKRGVDQAGEILHNEAYLIHIEDYKRVLITTESFEKHQYRVNRLIARAQVPTLALDKYISREQLNIMLQTMFTNNEQQQSLLSFIGRIAIDTSVEESDDGVGQTVTAKQGISRKGKEMAPAAYVLAPYRTFFEAEQPTSPFILRLREGETIEAALFEADGGAWKIKAMQNIKDKLVWMLTDAGLYKDYEDGKIIILA